MNNERLAEQEYSKIVKYTEAANLLAGIQTVVYFRKPETQISLFRSATKMDQQQTPVQPRNPNQPAAAYHDPDEINLLEYLYALVHGKWLIIGVTALGLILGYAAARIKGPVYQAYAVIAPRETESSSNSPNLGNFGMLGGIVASQLSMGGNASLDKIETILDSKQFNAQLIESHGFMPFMYPEDWDSIQMKWDEEFVVPKPLAAGAALAEEFLEKEINKNNTMTITVEARDSVFADTLIDSYLSYLDAYIRTSVQDNAKENRIYLEEQLIGVTDPLLRAKIQELIAKEVEKMMVVSKEAFTIIDPPYIGKSFKEKKLYPIVFAFGLFFLSSLLVVLGHAFSSADKTDEDKMLIEKMKGELFKPPFAK